MRLAISSIVLAFLITLTACDVPPKTSDDIQNQQQEKTLKEGASEVGIPGVTRFTEKRLLHDLYQLRDKGDVSTYAYTQDMEGRLWHICDSIGYGLPYAVQYTAPERMAPWQLPELSMSGVREYGIDRLPQPEPNGLFMPSSADGTWIVCIDHGARKPIYFEPHVIVSPFKLHAYGEYQEPQ